MAPAIRQVPWPVLALMCAACLDKAPALTTENFNDPACDGTQEGNACLTLTFSVQDSIREAEPARCKGYLHWALYRGGDVGIFGPGSNSPVQKGTVPNVDLSEPGSSYSVTLPDMEPTWYQILGFVGQTTDSSAVSGDPVTFPSSSFRVPADQHTDAAVVFDYVR